MKKNYNAPKAEMVKFDYNNQVVASDGGSTGCHYVVSNEITKIDTLCINPDYSPKHKV